MRADMGYFLTVYTSNVSIHVPVYACTCQKNLSPCNFIPSRSVQVRSRTSCWHVLRASCCRLLLNGVDLSDEAIRVWCFDDCTGRKGAEGETQDSHNQKERKQQQRRFYVGKVAIPAY